MTVTTVSAGNKATQWDADFFTSYVRANRFKRYMGTDENSIIVLKDDLTVKAGGVISIPLITELTGAGVTGNTALEGAEEALGNYDMPITVATLRHGVAITDNEDQYTPMDLRGAAKSMLKLWAGKMMRDGIVGALSEVSSVVFSAASAANKNAWSAANADRILYGAAVGNYSATFATGHATIDNTADKLTYSVVSLAKRIAKTASPIIRPVTVTEDEENYVMFAGSLAFRDLKLSLATINQNAEVRGKENPLYRDGDLVWDGVIIREIPEIAVVSNGTINTSPCYLCGAQAAAVAWAKRTTTTTDVRDYGFVKGVGIHEMRGIRKMVYNGKDHGVVTVWVAAVADA